MYDKLLPCPSSHRRVEGMNKNSGLFLAALPPGESLTRRSPRSGGMNVARRSTLGYGREKSPSEIFRSPGFRPWGNGLEKITEPGSPGFSPRL